MAKTKKRKNDMMPDSLRCIVVCRVWKSNQNGVVYDPTGLSPCIMVGCHSGVEPKIIVYE